MKTGPQLDILVWIATWSAIIAVVVYTFVETGEMRMVDRVLFAIDTILMLAWLLALILEEPDEEP